MHLGADSGGDAVPTQWMQKQGHAHKLSGAVSVTAWQFARGVGLVAECPRDRAIETYVLRNGDETQSNVALIADSFAATL